MWPPFKVSISETKVKFWPHIAAHFSISLCLNCWGGCVVAMQSVSICVKVKSKKWTTNDCEEEEEEEAQAGKDGKISMGSFPAKKMLWCFVSRIIHKNCDAMCKRWCPRPRPSPPNVPMQTSYLPRPLLHTWKPTFLILANIAVQS